METEDPEWFPTAENKWWKRLHPEREKARKEQIWNEVEQMAPHLTDTNWVEDKWIMQEPQRQGTSRYIQMNKKIPAPPSSPDNLVINLDQSPTSHFMAEPIPGTNQTSTINKPEYVRWYCQCGQMTLSKKGMNNHQLVCKIKYAGPGRSKTQKTMHQLRSSSFIGGEDSPILGARMKQLEKEDKTKKEKEKEKEKKELAKIKRQKKAKERKERSLTENRAIQEISYLLQEIPDKTPTSQIPHLTVRPKPGNTIQGHPGNTAAGPLPKLNGPFQPYEVPQQFRETQQFRESCIQHPSSRDWSKYIERQHFSTSLSNTVHHFPTNSNIKYQMTPTKEFRPSSTPVQNTRTHATMNLHIPMARQTVIVSSTNTRTSTTKLSQTEPSSWLCATQVAPTYQGKLVSPTYEPTNRAIVGQAPTANAQVRHQDSWSTQGTRTKCQDPMCRKAIRKCQDCRKHT